jgi:hypothetical protein
MMTKPKQLRALSWKLCRAAVATVSLMPAGAAFAQNAPVADAQRQTAEESAVPVVRAPAESVRLRSQTTVARDGAVDNEFGVQQIVERKAHVEPWSVVADVQLFNTDNVALTPTSQQRDWYLRYGLAVSYTNRIKGPLFIDLSLEQYLFRYDRFDSLNFDLTHFQGGLLVQAPWLANALFYARYDLTRIAEPDFGTAHFTSHMLDLGGQKVWKISRGQQIFAGAMASVNLETVPAISSRSEFSVTMGYSARLTERLTAALSYRGSWNKYEHSDRTDWNQIAAFGLTYDMTDWLRAGANVSYSRNDSNMYFADYQNWVTGCSLSLRIAF